MGRQRHIEPARKPRTDLERLVMLRNSLDAACGDWREITALWSVSADLDWLLERAEVAAGLRVAEAREEESPR